MKISPIASLRSSRLRSAFTLIEMLTVIAIILILSAILLNVAGYIQFKAACARAETEIKGFAAALENYKADNGDYPQDGTWSGSTFTAGTLDPRQHFDPVSANATLYQNSSRNLYRALTGDDDNDPTNAVGASGGKNYLPVKQNMLATSGSNATNTYFQDPFGYPYGYSTIYQKQMRAGVTGTFGYNPTFDLWSTANGKTANDVPKWIKNW